MRRTTLRSLSKENASRHYKAKCGLWMDYSQSRRPMGVRKRRKLEMHGRLDWRGSCSWNWRTNARAIQVRGEGADGFEKRHPARPQGQAGHSRHAAAGRGELRALWLGSGTVTIGV